MGYRLDGRMDWDPPEHPERQFLTALVVFGGLFGLAWLVMAVVS
jgi:hypothetical protein